MSQNQVAGLTSGIRMEFYTQFLEIRNKSCGELDSLDLIGLVFHRFLMDPFDLGKVKRNHFVYACSTTMLPDIGNSIYCPLLQPLDPSRELFPCIIPSDFSMVKK